ncbi:hypothetical protein ACIFQM_11065 [Paenibacillus sp. NRS-1782]|uniref:BC1872 family protein n=1 Tax=unclassified Paenibacillus TaxID=185978 RepID=UPI003D2763AB
MGWNVSERERDAWIEREVFGGSTYGTFREVNEVRVLIPHYTAIISDAWAVLERFPYIEVARIPTPKTTYGVRINGLDGSIRVITQKATFPEAIGLAAIIAKLATED